MKMVEVHFCFPYSLHRSAVHCVNWFGCWAKIKSEQLDTRDMADWSMVPLNSLECTIRYVHNIPTLSVQYGAQLISTKKSINRLLNEYQVPTYQSVSIFLHYNVDEPMAVAAVPDTTPHNTTQMMTLRMWKKTSNY